MTLLLKRLYEGYGDLMLVHSDPRTRDWFLSRSPVPLIAIMVTYVLLVKELGPKWMENRKPFDLKKVMMVFNIGQILINSYMVVVGTPLILGLDIRCTPIDYSYEPFSYKIAEICWIYYMTKISDLLDTIFIVLRKRDRQLSFLHVYHHCGMCFAAWLGTKFLAGGSTCYVGYINAFVHAIMYTYYLLASYSDRVKKSIWWKKHITQLQLLQFVFIFVVFGQMLFRPTCTFPKLVIMSLFIPQSVIMMVLFGDFYYKNYIRKGAPQKQKTT